MKNPIWIILSSILVVAVGVVSLAWRDRTTASGRLAEPLTLFCAAANRAAVEKIVDQYQKEFGREVHLEFGPSQTLLSRCEIGGTGDLFLPADDSFIKLALDKSIVLETIPIAQMRPVLVVPKGNPKSITSFNDLVSRQLRVVQADSKATAIGQKTRQALESLGLWEQLELATVAFRGTVTDVANDVQLDAADVGIVFDVVLSTYPDLEAVEIRELSSSASNVEIGVLATSRQPTAALHLARYFSSRDRGLMAFRDCGFQVVDGDVWADQPELTVFAGSMLRPAISDAIARFEMREGVRVSTVYNGCGILVGQMKGGQIPDAYFACDVEFMNQVEDLFPEPVDVSENELVIVVPKGNPKQIGSLRDLTRPGLRVGIGHEKQCAMGWLTQNTFREGGVQKEIMDNVTVEVPAGDMLVNQMRAGSLDAAVVYLSNAAGAADILDAVQIQGISCAVAVQPWAIYKESKFPQTASRLFQTINSPEGQADFEAEGFRLQKK
jgi:molybdate transport system substrate-binding protein